MVCDWLGMTPPVAYGALHHLHSVLIIPSPEAAERQAIGLYHKSLSDYLLDWNRSGVFPELAHEREEFIFLCARRILKSVSVEGIVQCF